MRIKFGNYFQIFEFFVPFVSYNKIFVSHINNVMVQGLEPLVIWAAL